MPLKRAPLVDRVPKALKLEGNRRQRPAGIPANIRVDGLTIADEDRDHIRRRLGEKLGRHAKSVERVSVRLHDINGPRGGVDVMCRIKVVLSGLPSVLVEHRATTLKPAVTAALAAVERSVRRALQRQRTRPARVLR